MKPVVFMCVCMSWIALACHEDKYIIDQPTGNIGFRIVSDGETASRSVSDSRIDIDGQELSLVWSVEKNTDSLQISEGAESRGVPYDNTAKLISSIYTTAIYPEGTGGKFYFKDEEVAVSSNKTGASGHYWPEQSLSFFAYAFSGNHQTIEPTFERKNSKCIGSFNYALPVAATEAAPKDASAQPDVVFAIAPDQEKEGGPVELVFHHALSAIVFKVGNMPSGIRLKSIAISGVYASGSCTMVEAASQSKPLDVQFTWSCPDNQTFVYTESLGSAEPVEGTQMGGAKATFMMLPQTMSDNTKLVFTFSVGGEEYNLEKSFKDVGVNDWKADHKYTFTIGIPDDIDVKVEDMVDQVGLVKDNLTIQNTGIVTGYIRAAIVGYWKNGEGVIEAPWSPDNDEGDFVKAADWGTHWKKGTDGFYYHLQPVGGNEFTAKLFDTYTLKSEVAENNKDLILEISIVAQIIPEDQKSLWSELNSSN